MCANKVKKGSERTNNKEEKRNDKRSVQTMYGKRIIYHFDIKRNYA